MREVSRDDKWNEETNGRMKEVQQGMNDSMDSLEAQSVSTDANAGSRQPSETELVIVALLMRLYDLNLAILNTMDEKRADEIYEAHEKGGHFNPPVFIPDVQTPGTTVSDAD